MGVYLSLIHIFYEAHVGMAQEKEGVGTYREFTEKILPIIKKDGYNAVQLMEMCIRDSLSTDHAGLYEKWGFRYLGQGYHPWGAESRIYERTL